MAVWVDQASAGREWADQAQATRPLGIHHDPVSGSSPQTDLGVLRQSVSGAVPAWIDDDGNKLMLTASVRNSLFFTDAILPDTHTPFPNELWSVSVGTNYLHTFDNGWKTGLGLSVGSASDQPFHSINEMTFGVNAFLQIPSWNERDSWRFSLMYSPTGNVDFPIPGVAYLWNPSDDLHLSIGLPLAIMWRPAENLTLTASYVPLTNVNARATYRLGGGLSVFGGFEWVTEVWELADRTDVNDRFMGEEKRLIGGVRWEFCQQGALGLNAGYAFDRFYGEGHSPLGSLQDRVDVAPARSSARSCGFHF